MILLFCGIIGSLVILMKFSIITFGCKVNAYESEYMKEELVKNGYIYTFSLPEANLIIINTCSVTNTADNKCKKR